MAKIAVDYKISLRGLDKLSEKYNDIKSQVGFNLFLYLFLVMDIDSDD